MQLLLAWGGGNGVLSTGSVRTLLKEKNIILKGRSVVTTPRTSLQVLDNTSSIYNLKNASEFTEGIIKCISSQ